jgi:hypothetical protein
MTNQNYIDSILELWYNWRDREQKANDADVQYRLYCIAKMEAYQEVIKLLEKEKENVGNL